EATKIAVNANGVFTSGTYNYSGFKIGNITTNQWSNTISVYGTTNHFVFKTAATLNDPTSGWMSGVAASTTGTSRGNTLINDATHNVYYLGDAFNGYTVLTGTAGQTMTPYNGYDGFIARFDDNSGANFRLLPFENDSMSKISENKILIYPNPSNGKIKITSLKNSEIHGIVITDIAGRVVYKKNFETGLSETKVDLSFLMEGSYFANVLTNDENKNVIKF
ncbi:MAG: T9SS type A sorting domain-containing protein, partial [Bacteroidales bacterium]|nr:T9SS type A sorting domain-containing protein [Bacteroidales bacterium]